MADMELIIKIPEERYEFLKTHYRIENILDMAILNGIQLPKKHEKLIILSEDVVKREQTRFSFSQQNWINEIGLSNATVAIIEANKE